MSTFFLPFIFLLSFALSSSQTITFPTSIAFEPSCLAWDPTSKHFVMGSKVGSTVHAISQSGVVKELISEPSATGANNSVTAVAIDHNRSRMIVAFANRSSIMVYDLKSYNRIHAVPLPVLDGPPGGVTVDLETGNVFVTSSMRAVVVKIVFDGDAYKISKFENADDEGFSGLAYVSTGDLLITQPTTGKLFKMDSNNGSFDEVIWKRRSNKIAPAGHSIALYYDRSWTPKFYKGDILAAAIATNQSILLVGNVKGWSEVSLQDKANNFMLNNETTPLAVAVTEGGTRAYVLAKSSKDEYTYMIEHVDWRLEYNFNMLLDTSVVLFALCILYLVISQSAFCVIPNSKDPNRSVVRNKGSSNETFVVL